MTCISSLHVSLSQQVHISSSSPSSFSHLSFVSVVHAQKDNKDSVFTPTYFSHQSIKQLIHTYPSIQHVESFELGSINWTQRVMYTLGVGTHRILSPTGGWTQQDLQKVAHQNAHSKLQRLAQTALFLPAQHTCPLEQLSRIYQTQNRQTFSDGSVHLPTHITFDAFQPCFYNYLESYSSNKSKSESEKNEGSYISQEAHKNRQHAHQVYSKIHQQKRAIVWLYVDDQKVSDILMKTIALNLRNQHHKQHPLKFLAVRWFKLPEPGSTSTSSNTTQSPSTSMSTTSISQLQKAIQQYKPYLVLWAKNKLTNSQIPQPLVANHFMPLEKWEEMIQSKAPTLSQLHSWVDDVRDISHAHIQELALYAPQSELWVWSRH